MTLPAAEVLAARERIGDTLLVTPCVPARQLSQELGAEVRLKCESLQRTGSFKPRGALNKMLQLPAEVRQRGVVCASAGNHAQAVAFAAARLGAPALIVMPETTPLVKVSATRQWGAEIVLHGTAFDEATERAQQLQRERGLTYVHAFDDEQVIAGQGTVGLELLEQFPELDTVIVPIGGGGLISGIADGGQGGAAAGADLRRADRGLPVDGEELQDRRAGGRQAVAVDRRGHHGEDARRHHRRAGAPARRRRRAGQRARHRGRRLPPAGNQQAARRGSGRRGARRAARAAAARPRRPPRGGDPLRRQHRPQHPLAHRRAGAGAAPPAHPPAAHHRRPSGLARRRAGDRRPQRRQRARTSSTTASSPTPASGRPRSSSPSRPATPSKWPSCATRCARPATRASTEPDTRLFG